MDKAKYMNKVLNLKKSLYGLRDAAKIWFETVLNKVKSFGLTEMESAPCVFYKKGMIVPCYVHDLLVGHQVETEIEELKTILKKH